MNITQKLSLIAGISGLSLMCVIGSACASSKDAALGNGLFARITTNQGEIVIRLEYKKVPLTVCNFVALAEGKMTAAGNKPYYDGLTFHRVISVANGNDSDFMIQGGDPLGTGGGGPGYRFPDEFDPSLRHDTPGVLSMANAGPGTNGSQFFITLVPTPWLDNRHTVFGRVVQGQDVVNKTKQGDKIEKIRIIRNGQDANAFKADQETFDTMLNELTVTAEKKVLAERETNLALIEQTHANAIETKSGIKYIVQKQGTGSKPVVGQIVQVKYTGMFLSGEVFDSSDIQGRPIEFIVGTGRVIPGWDEIVLDMPLNEKRTAIIPPELAYGNRATGPIPANSYLVFEMELIGIRNRE